MKIDDHQLRELLGKGIDTYVWFEVQPGHHGFFAKVDAEQFLGSLKSAGANGWPLDRTIDFDVERKAVFVGG